MQATERKKKNIFDLSNDIFLSVVNNKVTNADSSWRLFLFPYSSKSIGSLSLTFLIRTMYDYICTGQR